MIVRATAVLAAACLLAPISLAQGDETGTTKSRPLVDIEMDAVQSAILEGYEPEGVRNGEEFAWTLHDPNRRSKSYARYELTYPSPVVTEIEENNTVHGKYWRPHGEEGETFPAAVVLHWLGGSFEALDLVCAGLAQKGICALMIYMPHYGPRRQEGGPRRRMIDHDNDVSLANFRQAVLDIRRAGDWLAARPETQGDHLGLLGVSLGAVVGTLVAGIDPRFDRVVLLIGGGDLPAIATNGSREMRQVKQLIDEHGLSREDLQGMWRPIEPLTWASRIRPERVLMINADDDEIIPKTSTLQLRDAIGLEEGDIVWFKGGHYDIALNLFTILPRSARHLKQRTGEGDSG